MWNTSSDHKVSGGREVEFNFRGAVREERNNMNEIEWNVMSDEFVKQMTMRDSVKGCLKVKNNCSNKNST